MIKDETQSKLNTDYTINGKPLGNLKEINKKTNIKSEASMDEQGEKQGTEQSSGKVKSSLFIKERLGKHSPNKNLEAMLKAMKATSREDLGLESRIEAKDQILHSFLDMEDQLDCFSNQIKKDISAYVDRSKEMFKLAGLCSNKLSEDLAKQLSIEHENNEAILEKSSKLFRNFMDYLQEIYYKRLDLLFSMISKLQLLEKK